MSVHRARSDHSSVLVASMHGGRANALDPATVGGLAEAVTGLDGHEALVVTGLPGVFTGGLDLAILNGGGEPADSLQAAMGHLLLRLAAHAEIVGPDGAVALGLADEVVPQTELLPAAVVRAAELAALPTDAYATTKLRVTGRLRNTMRTALTR